MADDWSNIALRLAVYLDLMVLFGVPLFALQARGPAGQASGLTGRYTRLAGAAAALGAVLSVLGLLAMARQITGASEYSAITGRVLGIILTNTAAGITWLVRMAALFACMAALTVVRGRPALRFGLVSGAGAVALATLAWTGHGAMDDGPRGYLHLASDVLHLAAAGAWVGALVGFVSMSIGRHRGNAQSIDALGRTAVGFARIGTAIVAALFVSGVINYVLIAGPSLGALFTTLYGRLLVAKLGLIGLMLALAAANRFVFSPRLALAAGPGHRVEAVRHLRRSLAAEASLGFVVLALVAWLGVLSPQAPDSNGQAQLQTTNRSQLA